MEDGSKRSSRPTSLGWKCRPLKRESETERISSTTHSPSVTQQSVTDAGRALDDSTIVSPVTDRRRHRNKNRKRHSHRHRHRNRHSYTQKQTHRYTYGQTYTDIHVRTDIHTHKHS